MEAEPHQPAVSHETPVAEQDRLAQNDGDHGNVYGTAHVANRPVTTRFCVGAIGAGVPSPCRAKRANESTSPGTPARMIITPMQRISSNQGTAADSTRHRPWNEPRQVHGATTKKIAEPRTAIVPCAAFPTLAAPPSPLPLMVSRRHPGADTLAMLSQERNRARLKPEPRRQRGTGLRSSSERVCRSALRCA